MDAKIVTLILSKEVREARRNSWFLLFAAIFAGLSLTVSLLGLASLGSIGSAGFGRTTASLLNLIVLVVPLMGLMLGALSIVGEREQGTLATLLSQPVLVEEVFLGKFLGLAAALVSALLGGFGLTALVIARGSGPARLEDYLLLAAWTCLFGLGYLSLGFLVSAIARKTAAAMGVALLLWLVSVFLSDLGLIGTAIVLRLSPRALLWLSLLNPAQVFKLLILDSIGGNLEILGPGGLYATEVFGRWLRPALAALLAAWLTIPLAVSLVLSRNRGAS
ncbi:MAG TPA: ABC transporter permease subunit [Gemmataceae bacterium]|jgi:Cu-processing system permease protein